MEFRIPGAETAELPPYLGTVLKKYIPGYGKTAFFVELKVNDRLRRKAMFDERHFAAFEIGDFIGFEATSSPGGEWLRVRSRHDVTRIRRAEVDSEEFEIGLGYVSAPRYIGGREYFVSKSDDGWLRIPGDVMRAYFFGGENGARVSSDLPRYYAVLELPSMEVSREEIRQAFRRLARVWHPDVNSAPEAEDRFKEINEAHQELGDEQRRRLYDRQARAALGERESVHNGAALASYWPGRGFGKLTAVISPRGDTLLVEEILSWERNRRFLEFRFPLSEVVYGNWGIEIEHQGWNLSVHREDLPFEPNEIFNKIREALEGEVAISCEAVESGSWDRARNQPIRRWDVDRESLQMEWSDSLLQEMERLVVAFQEAQRLREAMRVLRDRGVWTRENLEELAEEYDVDVENLVSSFWHPDYDVEFFKALEVNAREICYTDWYFVLRVGSAIVVEQPSYGTATYVFDGSQEPYEVALKFAEVNRLELRRDPALQRELGYRGFAIHTTIGPWFTKVHSLVS